jgi:hypothetical protein
MTVHGLQRCGNRLEREKQPSGMYPACPVSRPRSGLPSSVAVAGIPLFQIPVHKTVFEL